jgi:hypothetical protein
MRASFRAGTFLKVEDWPVDKRVGNVRNDGPDLITPEIPPEPDGLDAAVPNLL